MCEHTFVTIKAGSFFCEECGLFLPTLPEQMMRAEKPSDPVDATVQDIMKDHFVHAVAQQMNRSLTLNLPVAPKTTQSFQNFTQPLIRAVFPREIADEMFTIEVSGGR